MGAFEEAFWQASLASGVPRREQRACRYQCYLPDRVSGATLLVEGEVAADISDAEAAIREFNASAPALADTEGIARLLLRTEAVASSRIEGVIMASGRLLRAEAAHQTGSGDDVTATEILGNIEAMRRAIDLGAGAENITVDDLLEVHRCLLTEPEMAKHAGKLRSEQNWIGGNRFNPCGAAYVPPPPELVPELMEDLCALMNEDSLPPLVQAAITHAQFETIHPFADGNGRTGRALIHTVLRRRGLVDATVLPISLVLATWSDRYVAGLAGYRFAGESDSVQAREATNQWLGLFSVAARVAVQEAARYQERITKLQATWRERLRPMRRDSSAELLIQRLPGSPVVTANSAAALIGRSYPTTNDAINDLVEAGILVSTRIGRRNRAFEAQELIALFTDFERQLSSPDMDTNLSSPVRGAPARPANLP